MTVNRGSQNKNETEIIAAHKIKKRLNKTL